MTGFDASSSELYSGLVEIHIELDDDLESTAIALVESRVEDFLKALYAGYFHPGTIRSSPMNGVHFETTSLHLQIEVTELTATAFAVLGGVLMDCRYHEVAFRSAYAVFVGDKIDLLVDSSVRPAAAANPPFAVDFPTDIGGNYALLVEIEFANPVESDIGKTVLDSLALWEVLSIAYPLDTDEPVEVCGSQGHFNDPRTIHHHEWVWGNADPAAWNLLVNLCCAWNSTLRVVRLKVE